MFTRTESFPSFIRLYPIISIITAIHILLWLVISLPIPFSVTIIEQLIGVNFWIAEGELWRLITPIFLHISFFHMLFNTFSLVLFGPALERMLGKSRFLITYVGTGIIANIATYFLEPLQYSHLGASGAIFGLFGVYVYIVTFRKDLIDQANSQVIITIIVIALVMTFVNSNINVVAHLFGGLAGTIIAPFVIKNKMIYYTDHASSLNIQIRQWKKFRPKFSFKSFFWIIIGILILFGLFAR